MTLPCIQNNSYKTSGEDHTHFTCCLLDKDHYAIIGTQRLTNSNVIHCKNSFVTFKSVIVKLTIWPPGVEFHFYTRVIKRGGGEDRTILNWEVIEKTWDNKRRPVLSYATFAMSIVQNICCSSVVLKTFIPSTNLMLVIAQNTKNKSIFSNSTLVLYCIYSLMTQ